MCVCVLVTPVTESRHVHVCGVCLTAQHCPHINTYCIVSIPLSYSFIFTLLCAYILTHLYFSTENRLIFLFCDMGCIVSTHRSEDYFGNVTFIPIKLEKCKLPRALGVQVSFSEVI